jgi:hypothetical protein
MNPWDQLPDEPGPAYAAFLAYRDLGRARTVRGAYRQAKSNPGATQASGAFSGLAKRYCWAQRAQAWDAYLEEQRNRVIVEKHTRWARRWYDDTEKLQALSDRLGRLVLDKLDELLASPVEQREVDLRTIDRLIDRLLALQAALRQCVVVDTDRISEPALREIAQVIGPTPSGVMPPEGPR